VTTGNSNDDMGRQAADILDIRNGHKILLKNLKDETTSDTWVFKLGNIKINHKNRV
jgi:hypothetical protein